jgi:predicted RND superfamily exporter protein
LLVASRNIIIALSAISSVAIAIVSVLYVIVTRDWRLGIAESICLIIILGLSVDYTVHLANEFIHSQHRHRKYKMKQAYKNIGVSIFGGALATFGAGALLYGAELLLYQKFAIIICCTVVISFIVSTIFFGAMMHIFGPMRSCGDILYFCIDKETAEDEDYRI